MTVHNGPEEIIDLTGFSETTLPEWDPPARGPCLLPSTSRNVTRDGPCNPHDAPTGNDEDDDDEHALIVYSRFADHDSHELQWQFQQTAQSIEQGICRLHRFEWHAHCVSPHSVPLASLSTLLTSCRTTLHTLSLWHVRLLLVGESFDGESSSNDDGHHQKDLVRFVTALASLQSLQHLTWEPLPSCLWNGWDSASVRPINTTRPPNSSSCASPPSVLFWKALTHLSALKTVSFSQSRTHSSFLLRQHVNGTTTNNNNMNPTGAPLTDSLVPSNTTHTRISPPPTNSDHNLLLFPSWMARLQQLNLTHVPLTHSQCQLIAQGLSMGGTAAKTCPHHQLKKLNLSSSTFVHGIADCQLLLHALRYNHTVTCLDLDLCRVVVGDDEQETETATNLPRHDETRTTTHHSLTHTPWIRQCVLQTLLCVLEESNTTLTSVSLVSSSSLLVPQSRQEGQRQGQPRPPSQQQVVPLSQQSHNRNLKDGFVGHRGKVKSVAETVPFLLSLNRSGLRHSSLLEKDEKSLPTLQFVLPHILFHTVRHSPTVTFQLVHTLVVESAASLVGVPPPPPPRV